MIRGVQDVSEITGWTVGTCAVRVTLFVHTVSHLCVILLHTIVSVHNNNDDEKERENLTSTLPPIQMTLGVGDLHKADLHKDGTVWNLL